MTMIRTLTALVLSAAIAASALMPTAAVGGQERHEKAQRKDRDHDAARQAVLRGEVLPLPRILTMAARYQRGEVIEIELEGKAQRLIYEVHVLTSDGLVRELLIDARTGKLIANQPKDD